MVVMVLVVWVFSGPITMAFSDCDRIGAICKIPCCLPCGGEPALASAAALPDFACPFAKHPERPPAIRLKGFKLPP